MLSIAETLKEGVQNWNQKYDVIGQYELVEVGDGRGRP
jgi:hypothetical protein